MRMTLEEAQKRYGPIYGQIWYDEADWGCFIPVPDRIMLVNTVTQFIMRRVYCNRDMAPALEAALLAIVAGSLQRELETFDGCKMVRDVRGEPGKPSTHSYALAIDLNAHKNPLGGKSTWSEAFVKCFTDQGFAWGGNFHRRDPMHFSFAWE